MSDRDPRPRRSSRVQKQTSQQQSAFLSLEADASDDDVPLANLTLEEARREDEEVAKDVAFINDEEEHSDELEDYVVVTQPGADAESPPLQDGPRRRRASKQALEKMFGSDSDDDGGKEQPKEPLATGAAGESETESASASESEESDDVVEKAPPKRKKGRPPKEKKRESMALWKRVGQSQNEPDAEFEPVPFGFYFAQVGGDLDMSVWRTMCDWFQTEAYSFSAGYERGDAEENLHGQVQGE